MGDVVDFKRRFKNLEENLENFSLEMWVDEIISWYRIGYDDASKKILGPDTKPIDDETIKLLSIRFKKYLNERDSQEK